MSPEYLLQHEGYICFGNKYSLVVFHNITQYLEYIYIYSVFYMIYN